jgi:hypothetical protein
MYKGLDIDPKEAYWIFVVQLLMLAKGVFRWTWFNRHKFTIVPILYKLSMGMLIELVGSWDKIFKYAWKYINLWLCHYYT